mmetsp:Transcript_81819/g.187230  ORF Transcript_81819/g.187230 Transcript_81819/m.187230 type:complete len:152 (+) Transcript_81819:24-479(+)
MVVPLVPPPDAPPEVPVDVAMTAHGMWCVEGQNDVVHCGDHGCMLTKNAAQHLCTYHEGDHDPTYVCSIDAEDKEPQCVETVVEGSRSGVLGCNTRTEIGTHEVSVELPLDTLQPCEFKPILTTSAVGAAAVLLPGLGGWRQPDHGVLEFL